MATGNINTTSVDAFIPEIWSKEIILTATDKAVARPLVREVIKSEIEDGDKIHFPLFSAVTVGTKTADNAVTYTNYSENTKDITINQHKYVAFRVENIAKIQARADLMAGYTTQGGLALKDNLDTAILANAIHADVTQNVGATSSAGAYQDITDAVIRSAIQKLDEANAPENDRVLVISPAQKNAMLGIDKFSLANESGDNQTLRTGRFGRIYDVEVYVSNNLPDVATVTSVASSSGASAIAAVTGRKTCVMFHKEAFGLGVQAEMAFRAAFDIDHLATSVVGDLLYGTAPLVPTFAVQVRTTIE